jgi:hypothetical protein
MHDNSDDVQLSLDAVVPVRMKQTPGHEWAMRGWGRILSGKEVRQFHAAVRKAQEKKLAPPPPKWVNPWQ